VLVYVIYGRCVFLRTVLVLQRGAERVFFLRDLFFVGKYIWVAWDGVGVVGLWGDVVVCGWLVRACEGRFCTQFEWSGVCGSVFCRSVWLVGR